MSTPHQETVAVVARAQQLAIAILLVAMAVSLLGCCPDRMLSVDAIKPSVEAVSEKFDALIDGAVVSGSMDAVEGETWKGESALLRHLVSDTPSAPVLPAPLLSTPPGVD